MPVNDTTLYITIKATVKLMCPIRMHSDILNNTTAFTDVTQSIKISNII